MKSAYHLIRTSVGSAPECNTMILIHNLVESTQSYILVQLKKKKCSRQQYKFLESYSTRYLICITRHSKQYYTEEHEVFKYIFDSVKM